jgi:hypothetical protein
LELYSNKLVGLATIFVDSWLQNKLLYFIRHYNSGIIFDLFTISVYLYYDKSLVC